jgi:hypothetical protein
LLRRLGCITSRYRRRGAEEIAAVQSFGPLLILSVLRYRGVAVLVAWVFPELDRFE